MKVSVIVPVYNVEKYLSKCLDSLVNQTLDDIDIILVDDESPDNSKDIIKDYMKKYPNIRYFFKKNGGQGSARNLGLSYATGEYIAYVDSDDYIEKDMLKLMYEKAKLDNADVVICSNNIVSLDNEIISINNVLKYDDDIANILYGNMAVWNKLYKKDILKDIKFREHLWYEDIDFTVKVLFNTNKISFINKPLYNYLLRPGSTMNNTNYKRNLELLPAFNEMISYLKSNNIYDKNYIKLEFLAFYHIYLTGITRIINIDVPFKLKKEIINEYINYINNNFPTFKKNRYIKYLDNNKKIVYKLLNLKMYKLIRFIFKVREGI